MIEWNVKSGDELMVMLFQHIAKRLFAVFSVLRVVNFQEKSQYFPLIVTDGGYENQLVEGTHAFVPYNM